MSDDLFAEAMAAAMATPARVPVEAPELPSEPVSEPEATLPPPVEEKAPIEELAPPHKATDPATTPVEQFSPRLLKLMEREAAAVAREQQLKEAEAKYATVSSQIAELESARARFAADPITYLRKLAPELKPADLAKALWYEELGEKAPVEYRVSKTEKTAKQTVDELRAEIEQRDLRSQEAANTQKEEEAHNRFIGALSSTAKSVPDEYPLVKSFSTQSPDRVTQGLYRMAQKHARATNGEVQEPAFYVAMLEKELASIAPVFASKATPPAPKVEPPSSLRNKHTTVQPTKTNAASDEELFEEAMRAVEAARARSI